MLKDGTKENPKYLMSSTDSYKEGDYILLPSKRPSKWIKDMDKFLGRVVEIVEIYDSKGFRFFYDDNWSFHLSELQNPDYYDYKYRVKTQRKSKLLLI